MLAGAYDGQADQATNAKILHSATHRFDVQIGRLESHPASPVGAAGSYRLATAPIEIRVQTKTATQVQLSARDELLATLSSDLELAAQALCMPGNVAATSALAATGIVSGMLAGPGGEGFPVSEIEQQDWERLRITSRISASAIFLITMPTA
jgi:hypothetical protein